MSGILDGMRAVFFDAVGTLLFPAVSVAATYRAVALRHGADIDEAQIEARFRDALLNEDRADAVADWQTSEQRERERWRNIVRMSLAETADPDGCFADLWEYYRGRAAWTVNGEAAMVLNELSRRGLIVGIASNFDRRLGDIVLSVPELALVANRCVISSLVGWRKPAARFFQAVVDCAGVTRPQILFVGDDRRNDVEAARATGMRAALFSAESTAESGGLQRLTDLLAS